MGKASRVAAVVGDRLLQQDAVGDGEEDALHRPELRLEEPHADDRPGRAGVGAEGDEFPRGEGAQHEQRDAGRDIAQRVAQAEPDGEGDAAERGHDPARVDAERGERRDAADEVHRPGDGVPCERLDRGVRLRDAGGDPPDDPPGAASREEGDEEDEECGQETSDGPVGGQHGGELLFHAPRYTQTRGGVKENARTRATVDFRGGFW